MTRNEQKMMGNYRGAFLQLLMYYQKKGDKDNYQRIWEELNRFLPEERVPFPNPQVKNYFEEWVE